MASSNQAEVESKGIPLIQGLAYAGPNIVFVMLVGPVAIIQGIYAKYYGLALTTIASIVLFARVFDAVIDPLVGHISDQYRLRHGTRKPFIVVGGLIYITGAWFLFAPPAEVTILYFMGCFVVYYIGWTLYEVPHYAWASEISPVSNQKLRLFGFRTCAGYAGLTLFYLVPLLPIFESTEITPETLRVTVMGAAILMVPLLFVSISLAPSGSNGVAVAASQQTAHQADTSAIVGARATLMDILANRPLRIFIAAFCLCNLSLGMWYGLIFTYIDAYIGLGDQFASVFLAAFIVGIIASPVWNWVGLAFDKRVVWAGSITLLIISFLMTGSLKPGETSLTVLYATKIVNTLGYICITIVPPTILSDIVDYSELKYGTRRAGTYFATYTIFLKFSSAVGMALSLALAGWFGFDATGTEQTARGIWGMQLSIVWAPVMLAVASLVLILMQPITRKRHAVIMRRLDARKRREHDSLSQDRHAPASDSVVSTKPEPIPDDQTESKSQGGLSNA